MSTNLDKKTFGEKSNIFSPRELENKMNGNRDKRMTNRNRLIVIILSLLLSVTYFVPLWEISMEAPQYPEGLGISIWINNITGQTKGDLNKINNLNHYIGMKHISKDAIPELKYMPWIMRALMIFGLIAGATGRRKILFFWLVAFIAMSIAGLVDYYLWGYDYGHNLDMEKAIIKIPGMSFQPPLIGVKQILNFKTTSLPGIGGYILTLSIIFGSVIYYLERKRQTIKGWRI